MAPAPSLIMRSYYKWIRETRRFYFPTKLGTWRRWVALFALGLETVKAPIPTTSEFQLNGRSFCNVNEARGRHIFRFWSTVTCSSTPWEVSNVGLNFNHSSVFQNYASEDAFSALENANVMHKHRFYFFLETTWTREHCMDEYTAVFSWRLCCEATSGCGLFACQYYIPYSNEQELPLCVGDPKKPLKVVEVAYINHLYLVLNYCGQLR